jgi:hypothetical protein
MELHGLLGDPQLAGDLGIGRAGRDEMQDFGLPLRQLVFPAPLDEQRVVPTDRTADDARLRRKNG